MTRDEILDFANRCRAFFLATATDGQPHVRGMMLARADAGGLVFSTLKTKDLCTQLETNPTVELCFCDTEDFVQVRIAGEVEQTDDRPLQDEMIQRFPHLQEWVDQHGHDGLVLWRLPRGTATIWTLDKDFEPLTEVAF